MSGPATKMRGRKERFGGNKAPYSISGLSPPNRLERKRLREANSRSGEKRWPDLNPTWEEKSEKGTRTGRTGGLDQISLALPEVKMIAVKEEKRKLEIDGFKHT